MSENEIKTNEDQVLVPAVLSEALVNEPTAAIEPAIVAVETRSISVPKSVDAEPVVEKVVVFSAVSTVEAVQIATDSVVDAEPIIVVKTVEEEPIPVIEPVITENNMEVELVNNVEIAVEDEQIVSEPSVEPITVADPIVVAKILETESIAVNETVISETIIEPVDADKTAEAETQSISPEPSLDIVEAKPVISEPVEKVVVAEPASAVPAVEVQPVVEAVQVVQEPVVNAEPIIFVKTVEAEHMTEIEPVIAENNAEVEPVNNVRTAVETKQIVSEPSVEPITVAEPVEADPVVVAKILETESIAVNKPVISETIIEPVDVDQTAEAETQSISVDAEPVISEPIIESIVVVEPIFEAQPIIVVKTVEAELMTVNEPVVVAEPASAVPVVKVEVTSAIEPALVVSVADPIEENSIAPVETDLTVKAVEPTIIFEIVAPVVIQNDMIVESDVSEPVAVVETLITKSVLDIEPFVIDENLVVCQKEADHPLVAEPTQNIIELNLLTESLIVDALIPGPISTELNNVEAEVSASIPCETNEDAKHLVDVVQMNSITETSHSETVEESSIESCRVVQTESVNRSHLIESNLSVVENNSKLHIEILATPQHSHTVISDNISFQTFSDESPPTLELNSADFLDDINVAANALNFHVVSPTETKISLKDEENLAATKIQSTFRGFKARKSLNQTNEAKSGHPNNNDL